MITKKYFGPILFVVMLGVALFFGLTGSGPRTYRIHATIDFPETIEFGDTILDTHSILEGHTICLVGVNLWTDSGDFNPEVLLDSAIVENNEFVFQGLCEDKEPYFVYVVDGNLGNLGMLVVEPGQIEVVIDMEGLTASGTPLNDGITDLYAGIQNLDEDFRLLEYSLTEESTSEDVTHFMEAQEEYVAKVKDLVDSVYEANQNNLVGVYATLLNLAEIHNSAELRECLKEYSEYVQNSEMVKFYIRDLEMSEAVWGDVSDSYIPELLEEE